MAYAAVISLKHIIKHLTIIDCSIDLNVREELETLRKALMSLDSTRNRNRMNTSVIDGVDAQIREALCKLEDVIESQLLLLHHSPPPHTDLREIRRADKEKVKHEILTFLDTVKKLRDKFTRELNQPSLPREEKEEDDVVLPVDGFGGKKSTTTVVLSDQIDKLIHELVDPQCGLKTISVVGMAGIGKTHLASTIYQHPIVVQHFDLLVWTSLGSEQQLKNLWADIVAQVERKPKNLYLDANIVTLVQLLERGLLGRRCLIVLDDAWSARVCYSLISLVRGCGRCGRVLLTTRLEQVGKDLDASIHKIRFLNNHESWDLLWRNVLGDDESSFSFPPPQLEKAGKKIAEKCEGLPLLILAVADILSGEDKTEEYWNKVADAKTTTFPDAYDKIFKVLFSSYKFLPQYLKPCFLYMGVFPQTCEIPLSKLINLLSVEGFMEVELSLTKVFKTSQSTNVKSELESLPSIPKTSKESVLKSTIWEDISSPDSDSSTNLPSTFSQNKKVHKIFSTCRGIVKRALETLHLLEPGPSLIGFVPPFEKISFSETQPSLTRVIRPSRKIDPLRQQQSLMASRNTDSKESEWSHNDTIDTREASELFLMECMDKLVSNSLAIVCKHSSRNGIKSCKLHSAYWYLCFKEARKNRFFIVLKSLADASKEYMDSQRRLSVQNNILFGIKEVYDSMASTSSTTRSLLCTGEGHEYPVPICLNLMLLKVLDALTIRFYEFPEEVLKLVRLKYLALTYNGNLPCSISNLKMLQLLIIRQHHNIKLLRDPTYLPIEIWDLHELIHLQIMGNNLPDPRHGIGYLPNLITLNVNAHSCTKAAFRSIPYLKKLGITIELQPSEAAETLRCLNHVGLLGELESLKCVVVNPRLKSHIVTSSDHLSNFPSGLKKLCLNGLGYSLMCMNAIASLPNLEVLKLRVSAFRGKKWEINFKEFRRLKFLLLEDIDVVHWTTYYGCFPHLRRLIIRHCYKLKDIPQSFPTLEMLEVVDCSPAVVASARRVQEERKDSVEVMIKSSWNL